METIRLYIENVFKALPQTNEVLRAKEELLSNAEAKYSELRTAGKSESETVAQVIGEFGDIDELIEELGIPTPTEISVENRPTLSSGTINEFLMLFCKAGRFIALGVALCIVGAAVLVGTTIVTEPIATAVLNRETLSSATGSVLVSNASVLGVVLLILFVIPAVALFIYWGNKMNAYKYIEQGEFRLDLSTKERLVQEYAESGTLKGIIAGICLCIFGVVVLLLVIALAEPYTLLGVCALMLIVALGVFCIISASNRRGAYQRLLQIEDFTPTKRKSDQITGAFASVVFPLATCIFLLWGWLGNGWYIAWVVYPITAILFGAFAGVTEALVKKK